MAAERLLGTRPQKAFIATLVIQAIIVLVMIAVTFRVVEDNANLNDSDVKAIPCYLALFALAEVFEIVMAFDALRARNTIQLAGMLLFHTALIVFSSLQIYEINHFVPQVWDKIRVYVIIAPCVVALSLALMLWWVRELYYEFGWAIFHVVGANPAMKTMYQYYQVMVCLLKFDFFFFVGVTMQMLIVVLSKNAAEFVLTIIAIPVVLVLLALCGLAVQREIKWMMAVSQGLMLAAETYLYKLVRFYEPSTKSEYSSTRITLTFFTIVAFLILFITFAIGLRCFADFDKGLLYAKTQSLETKRAPLKQTVSPNMSEMGGRQSAYMGGAPLGQRMSIE